MAILFTPCCTSLFKTMMIATASVDQNTIRRRGTGLRAYNPDKVFKGYTLFTPLTGKGEVYLLNLEGEVVHQWNLPYSPGLYAYLLPNGKGKILLALLCITPIFLIGAIAFPRSQLRELMNIERRAFHPDIMVVIKITTLF
jgi:hypothetical protein